MQRPSTVADFVGDHRQSGDQLNYKCCPECGANNWKTYLNPLTGMWYCHSPQHQRGGKVDVGLQAASPGRQVLEKLVPALRNEVRDWPEMVLPEFEPLCCRAINYMASRGVSPEACVRLGLVESQRQLRVLFPYFGPYGRLIYWSSRAYSVLEEGPKYITAPGRHPLYVLPRWEPASVRILVEGVMDAIAVHLHLGVPVIALGGKSLPRYLRRDLLQLATDRIHVMLDEDAGAAAFRLKAQLSDRRAVSILSLPRGQDPSSMGARLTEVWDEEQID